MTVPCSARLATSRPDASGRDPRRLAAGPLLAAGLLGLSAGAGAAEESGTLSGPEVRALISGEVVKLDTPFGLSLPLYYRADGTVKGDISGFSMAGMLAPREDGRWWIDGNRMCQKWPSWYDGKTACFTIRKLGPGRIGWLRDDGTAGTAQMGR